MSAIIGPITTPARTPPDIVLDDDRLPVAAADVGVELEDTDVEEDTDDEVVDIDVEVEDEVDVVVDETVLDDDAAASCIRSPRCMLHRTLESVKL